MITPDIDYRRLSVVLYRSLERLSLAIEACGRIGFEESKPTTNAHHASIWLDLNDAQKDAKLKLRHFQKAVKPIDLQLFYDQLVDGQIIKESDGEPWALTKSEAEQIVAAIAERLRIPYWPKRSSPAEQPPAMPTGQADEDIPMIVAGSEERFANFVARVRAEERERVARIADKFPGPQAQAVAAAIRKGE